MNFVYFMLTASDYYMSFFILSHKEAATATNGVSTKNC